MTRRETVHSELSQSEKRATLANDRRVHKGATYHAFATSEASAVGGRFSSEARQRVVGSASFKYPQLPEGAWPNQAAAVPPEECLGIDVNAQEPVGEIFERSLGSQQRGDEGIEAPQTSSPSAPQGGGELRERAGIVMAPNHSARRRRPPQSKRKG
jgi:hypothetical protein